MNMTVLSHENAEKIAACINVIVVARLMRDEALEKAKKAPKGVEGDSEHRKNIASFDLWWNEEANARSVLRGLGIPIREMAKQAH